jgi:hypothetical protein
MYPKGSNCYKKTSLDAGRCPGFACTEFPVHEVTISGQFKTAAKSVTAIHQQSR